MFLNIRARFEPLYDTCFTNTCVSNQNYFKQIVKCIIWVRGIERSHWTEFTLYNKTIDTSFLLSQSYRKCSPLILYAKARSIFKISVKVVCTLFGIFKFNGISCQNSVTEIVHVSENKRKAILNCLLTRINLYIGESTIHGEVNK